MGKIVLAAKITHVPSIWLSETSETYRGIRQNAIDGLVELGRRGRARGVDTYVVFDVHWIVNQGFHMNALPHLAGRFTSPELPHFLNGLDYDYRGDPELARAIAGQGAATGLKILAHDVANLELQYGTLIPMRHMNGDGAARVLSCAVNQYATIAESRRFGAAVAAGIAATDRRVGVLASGSLSHQFWPNAQSAEGIATINGEFNRQVDLRVLELLRGGHIKEFLAMLPDYAQRCFGEVGMGDTAMLFGALGWERYAGRGEQIGAYYAASGTGQVNMEFPLA